MFYPNHPFNEALVALSPLVGAHFLDSPRDDGGAGSPFIYPRIEYAVLTETNASWLPGQKLWRVSQSIQIDFLLTEAEFVAQCRQTRLEESQSIQAVQKAITDKIRAFLTYLIDPTVFDGKTRKEDFSFARFEWKLESWLGGFYFRKLGAKQETGASVRVVLSFLDLEGTKYLCCPDIEKLRDLAVENSVSWKILNNQI